MRGRDDDKRMTSEADRMSRAGSYVLGLMDEADRERAERDLEIDAAIPRCGGAHRRALASDRSWPGDTGRRVRSMEIAGAAHRRDAAYAARRARAPAATPETRNPAAVGRGLHAVPSPRAIMAVALIAAFAAGYLAALWQA